MKGSAWFPRGFRARSTPRDRAAFRASSATASAPGSAGVGDCPADARRLRWQKVSANGGTLLPSDAGPGLRRALQPITPFSRRSRWQWCSVPWLPCCLPQPGRQPLSAPAEPRCKSSTSGRTTMLFLQRSCWRCRCGQWFRSFPPQPCGRPLNANLSAETNSRCRFLRANGCARFFSHSRADKRASGRTARNEAGSKRGRRFSAKPVRWPRAFR